MRVMNLGCGLMLTGALLLLGVSCVPPDGAVLIPEAEAGCAAPPEDALKTNQNMLPGRVCESCHRAGGQATDSPFTLSGTVFKGATSACDPGGLEGVYVEVQDKDGKTQPNGVMRTNIKGNFYSTARFVGPMKVTVYQVDTAACPPTTPLSMVPACVKKKERPMGTLVGADAGGSATVGCATCHQIPSMRAAPGRVYLDID